jgi:hypothetical protein
VPFVFSFVPLVFRSRSRWAKSILHKDIFVQTKLSWEVPIVPSVNAITFEFQGRARLRNTYMVTLSAPDILGMAFEPLPTAWANVRKSRVR